MLYGGCLVAVRLALFAAGILVFTPLVLLLLHSIGADISGLTTNFGFWGLAIFAAPTLAMLVWSHWHPDGR